MMIKPFYDLKLTAMCPACGNYFYESEVLSYSCFGATAYSDGYTLASYGPYWLTRCPSCKRFFAKAHIFMLPQSVSPDFDSAALSRLVEKEQNEERRERFKQRLEEKRKKEALYGRLSGDFVGEGGKTGFIREAIAEGVYYPVTVNEREKAELGFRLRKDLWHEYNIRRESVSDKEYEGLCHVIIDMIEGKAYLKYDDRIALAELYRNVGEFEKCILLLDFFKKPNAAEKYIERIRGEAIKKNKATVIVE